MNGTISRRQFFATFVPSRRTRSNILRAAAIIAVATCFSIAASIVQSLGLVTTLKGVALGLGLMLALWLFARVTAFVESAFRCSPRVVQRMWAIIVQAALIAIAVGQAAEIYRRWMRGEDLVGVWIAVAVSLLAYLAGRGSKKSGEPGATDNPDDAQRLREDH